MCIFVDLLHPKLQATGINYIYNCRSPGYALHPQTYRPLGSISADSGSEVAVTEQSQQHHSSNLPFQLPQFTFAQTNMHGESSGSNLTVSESQMEAQKKILEHQIEVWEFQCFAVFCLHCFFSKS